MEKFVAVVFSLMILLQAWGLGVYAGSWIVPGTIFGLFWFLYTFVPLVGLWNVPVDATAILYILVCCIAFSLSAVPFQWRSAFRVKAVIGRSFDYGSPFIRTCFYAGSTLTIFCLIVDLFIQGVTVSAVLSNPLEVAQQMMVRRYLGQLTPNIFGQLSFVLQYPSAILGGFVFSSMSQGGRKRLVLLLTFLPSIMAMLLQGAKGALFLVLVLFWGAHLIYKVNEGQLKVFTWRDVRRSVPYAGVVVVFVTISFLSRILDASGTPDGAQQQIVRLFASYAAAHIYAFSDWFSELLGGSQALFYSDGLGRYGFYTFTALAKLFGNDTKVPDGVYEEYFKYEDMFQTNIYTMFRGLINDFGLGGSVLAMFAAGIAIHFAYYLFLRMRRPALSTSIFIHSIGFFYTSFIISLFIWNSIYASLMLTAAVLWVNGWFFSRRSARQGPQIGTRDGVKRATAIGYREGDK